MTPDENLLRTFADRFFRDALSKPDNLREFLSDAVPKLAPHFDFARTVFLKTEFVLPDWRRRDADLLFEIPYRFDDGERLALVCVLIEHQTNADPRMPLRMLLEATLYWERQWKAWEESAAPKEPFRLTPVLPIVLHTGNRPWGSARTLLDMLGPPAAFHSFAPEWRPIFWELSAHSPEQLLNADAAFLQMLTIVRAEDEEIAEFGQYFQEALRKLDSIHDAHHMRYEDMIKLSFGWVLHRRPREERQLWIDLAAATQEDERRKEELKAMAQTLGKTIYEEGMEYGMRQVVLAQGCKRFGEPTPAIRLALDKIEDANRLNRLSQKLLDATSWEAVLETE